MKPYEMLQKVCDAIGIDWRTRHVQRVVIDVSVRAVPKIYVQEVMEGDTRGPAMNLIAEFAAADRAIEVVELLADQPVIALGE